MIRVQIDQLLKARGRSFYWLAKETGVSHTTLWRLKKDKAQGITFNTLESICKTLKCKPGDVLTMGRNHKPVKSRRQPSRSYRATSSRSFLSAARARLDWFL